MPEELRWNKHLKQASLEVPGFTDLLAVFERNMLVLGRSANTFEHYARHIASLALHNGCLPTELGPEQVKDYLLEPELRGKLQALQTKLSHTPPASPVPTQNRRCPCCKTGQLAAIALFG